MIVFLPGVRTSPLQLSWWPTPILQGTHGCPFKRLQHFTAVRSAEYEMVGFADPVSPPASFPPLYFGRTWGDHPLPISRVLSGTGDNWSPITGDPPGSGCKVYIPQPTFDMRVGVPLDGMYSVPGASTPRPYLRPEATTLKATRISKISNTNIHPLQNNRILSEFGNGLLRKSLSLWPKRSTFA